jgi:anti-sigma factor RsiW
MKLIRSVEAVMNCDHIRELLPDIASGATEATPELKLHLSQCGECAKTLQALEQTMALLDEWEAPEPSPFFDTRMQALLREEQRKSTVPWYDWLRRPAFSAAAVLLLAAGVGVYTGVHKKLSTPPATSPAVVDLQKLDKDSDLLDTYAALDDDDSDDDTAVD